MKRLQIKINQRGDTIVEVLIVLSILSLAFAIAASTANRSLVKSRNSEEHSQALGNLSTQVEFVRAAKAKQITLPSSGPFCMTSSTTFDTSFAAGYSIPVLAKNDDFSKYAGACKLGNDYYLSIQYNTATQDFDFLVRWDGSAKFGRQQEELSYRNYELTPGANTIPVGSAASTLTVYARVIPPTIVPLGVDTPPCSDNATWTKDGISVTVRRVNGPPTPQSTTTVASVALFTSVIEGENYKATLVAPAGYEICPPNPSGTEHIPVGGSGTINMKLRPVCYLGALTRNSLGTYADALGVWADSLGIYSDPAYEHFSSGYYDHYSAPYYHHDGTDAHQHAGVASHSGHLSSAPHGPYNLNYREDVFAVEGTTPVWYKQTNRGAAGDGDGGTFYERWVYYSDFLGNYRDSLGVYPDPPYEHFGPPYMHYSAPYEHFGPWYQPHLCPS